MPSIQEKILESLQKRCMEDAALLESTVLSVIENMNKHDKNIKISKVSGSVAGAIGSVLSIIGGALTVSVVLAPVGVPMALAGVGVGVLGTLTNTGAGITGYFITRDELKKLETKLKELNTRLRIFNKHVDTLDEWEQKQIELEDIKVREEQKQNLKREKEHKELADEKTREAQNPLPKRPFKDVVRQKLRRCKKAVTYAKRGITGFFTAKSQASLGLAIADTVGDSAVIKAGVLSADDLARLGTKAVTKSAATTFGKVALRGGIVLSALGLAVDVGSVAYYSHQIHKRIGHEQSEGLKELAKRLREVARWNFPEDPTALASRRFSCSDLGSVDQFCKRVLGVHGKGDVSECGDSKVHPCAATRSRRYSF